MTKQEKKFIKFIGKKICEVIESYNYRYMVLSSDEITPYGRECFKEERYDDIEYFIQWAKDRGVNNSIIEHWNSINFELWRNNSKLIF